MKSAWCPFSATFKFRHHYETFPLGWFVVPIWRPDFNMLRRWPTMDTSLLEKASILTPLARRLQLSVRLYHPHRQSISDVRIAQMKRQLMSALQHASSEWYCLIHLNPTRRYCTACSSKFIALFLSIWTLDRSRKHGGYESGTLTNLHHPRNSYDNWQVSATFDNKWVLLQVHVTSSKLHVHNKLNSGTAELHFLHKTVHFGFNPWPRSGTVLIRCNVYE